MSVEGGEKNWDRVPGEWCFYQRREAGKKDVCNLIEPSHVANYEIAFPRTGKLLILSQFFPGFFEDKRFRHLSVV